jgi:hypothetical protein
LKEGVRIVTTEYDVPFAQPADDARELRFEVLPDHRIVFKDDEALFPFGSTAPQAKVRQCATDGTRGVALRIWRNNPVIDQVPVGCGSVYCPEPFYLHLARLVIDPKSIQPIGMPRQIDDEAVECFFEFFRLRRSMHSVRPAKKREQRCVANEPGRRAARARDTSRTCRPKRERRSTEDGCGWEH